MLVVQVLTSLALVQGLVGAANTHFPGLKRLTNDVNKIGVDLENLGVDFLEGLLTDSPTTSSLPTTTPTTLQEELTETEQPITEDYVLRQRREAPPPTCAPNPEEEARTHQHISELKTEVTKLKDLVLVLRDQQQVMKVLQDRTHAQEAEPPGVQPLHQELEHLKLNIKQVVASLNQTQVVLDVERRREQRLEVQIMKQQKELEDLRKIVDQLEKSRNQTASEIVGAPPFHPLTPPTIILANHNKTHTPMGRASDSGDLSHLIKLLSQDRPAKKDDSDLQSRILDLEDQLERQEKAKSTAKQLVLLQKLFEEDQKKKSETDVLKKLLQGGSAAQSKSDDDLDELRNLETAIAKLRPKEQNDVEVRQQDFQLMLNKLINAQGGVGVGGGNISPLAPPQAPPLRPPGPMFPYQPPDYFAPPYYSYDQSAYSYRRPLYQPYDYAPPPPPPQAYYSPEQFFPADKSATYAASPPPPPPNPPKYPSYPPAGQQQRIEDLKSQIYGLENVIKTFNRPDYPLKASDQQQIYELDHQINELKSVVGDLGHESYEQAPPLPQGPPPAAKYRRKRAIDESVMTQLVTELSKQADEVDNEKQLGRGAKGLTPKSALGAPANDYQGYNGGGAYQHAPQPYPQTALMPTELDHLQRIILKILDKLIGIFPEIFKRLGAFFVRYFSGGIDGYGYTTTNDYSPSYGGYNGGGLQSMFHRMGFFGLIPLFLLRIISGVSNLVHTLKKNYFVRTFLVPVGVLVVVGGGVLFLIWWLQPEDSSDYSASSYYASPGGGASPSQYYSYQPMKYEGNDRTYYAPQKPLYYSRSYLG